MFQTNFQSDTGLFKEKFLAAKSPVMALSPFFFFFRKNARIGCVLELCDETLTRFITHMFSPRNGPCICAFLFFSAHFKA